MIQDIGFDETSYKTIAVDGLDGAGKGSCVSSMADVIATAGIPVIISDYPNYKYPWGAFLDHLLHDDDEGLGIKDRMLVYSLNRLETVPAIQQKAKTYIEVYERVCVIFDRYATSNMITLSFYLLFRGVGEEYLKEVEKYLPYMWEIDKYFISGLQLEKTPVIVPILDAEETLKRIKTDIDRNGADFYEKTDVQDLARDLYLKASELDERIITFSQYNEEEKRYLTIGENAKMSLELTWPEVIEYPRAKKKAPIHQLEFEPSTVDQEALEKLLDEHGSDELKSFNPYK